MSILIAAGGTGGHIFPALVLAQELKKKRPQEQIILIGANKKLELELFKKNNCDYKPLHLTVPPGKLSFRTILFLLQFIAALFRSLKLVKELKPEAVVGFGSYVSVPIILAAKFMGIPTLIHEQNVMPGLANRFLAWLVDRIALSFPESQPFFKQKGKIVITGNPIRLNLLNRDKTEALDKLGLDNHKFTVLAMGGSQGAHFLNKSIIELVALLKEPEKDRLQFIHLSGSHDFNLVNGHYKGHRVKASVFSFLDDMALAYIACDLVIGRAGATTISEISALGRPSILIPYPYARGHQRFNALILKDKMASIVIEQENLTAITLKGILIDLMADKERLKAMSNNARSLSNLYAGENLAKEVLSLC